jgi:XTP/dITP diphosphohydrolase
MRELRRMLDGVVILDPMPEGIDVIEDGDTFLANAQKKARAVAGATGRPALADDSGIEVDALAGRPGVRSARFAGETATDEENLSLLLERLEGVPPERRAARYRCVMVLVDGSSEWVGEGTLEGAVIDGRRGSGGFGYDPSFVPEGDVRTVAQMSDEEKDLISHRALALRDLLSHLPTADPS